MRKEHRFIDRTTGRIVGDHGTGEQAIEYALDHSDGDLGNMETFLRCWHEGNLSEWPEYYEWLEEQDA